MIRSLLFLLIGAVLVPMSGCSSRASSDHEATIRVSNHRATSTRAAGHRKRLTEAEHDSVLATETSIPGSPLVGDALRIHERSARKARVLEAQFDSLTRGHEDRSSR